jgi:hypothetical protein
LIVSTFTPSEPALIRYLLEVMTLFIENTKSLLI